jgi:hypothetical protein
MMSLATRSRQDAAVAGRRADWVEKPQCSDPRRPTVPVGSIADKRLVRNPIEMRADAEIIRSE